jgi:plastocyanin
MNSQAQHSRRARSRRSVFGSGVAIVWLAAGAFIATVPAAAASDAASKSNADGGAQASYTVEIRNFAFTPKDLLVPAGARIVWTNRDDEPHVIVSAGGAFKASPALDTNESFAAVLAKPGTYSYYCGIHPMMVGRIVVH